MMLSERIRILPLVEYEEGLRLVTEEEAMYAGQFRDSSHAALELGSGNSFSSLTWESTCARVGWGDGHSARGRVLWMSAVLREEIRLMLELEEYGRKLVFFVSQHTIRQGILEDHVYSADGHPEFGFTSWEINHLLPMFPDACVISKMPD
jgi:hypothetical protein